MEKREIKNHNIFWEEVVKYSTKKWGKSSPPSTLSVFFFKNKEKWTSGLEDYRVQTSTPKHMNLYDSLYRWYSDLSSRNIIVSGNMHVKREKKHGCELGIEDLSYSNGWLAKFKKCHVLEHANLNPLKELELIYNTERFNSLSCDNDVDVAQLKSIYRSIAKDRIGLRNLGLTHIVNTAQGKDDGFHVHTNHVMYRRVNIDYLGIEATDMTSFDLLQYFDKCVEYMTLFNSIENIVTKGEIARDEQFHLLPQCFPKAPTSNRNEYLWSKGFSALLPEYGSGKCNINKNILLGFIFTGKVMVNCKQGASRSATIVLAYLMIKRHMKVQDAVRLVREKRFVPTMDFSNSYAT